jgi:Gram-negative bacterial TonB protein C-terminal
MRIGWGRGLVLVIILSAARAIGPAAVANEPTAVPEPRLPPAKGIDKVLPYQEEARRQGREGRVEFEFNIGADGKANRVALLLADDRSLSRDARQLLGAIRFDVPSDWESSGLGSMRYRLGMVYCLPPSGQSEQLPEGVSKMIITAARVAGAPVKHPVRPGAYGRCARANQREGKQP